LRPHSRRGRRSYMHEHSNEQSGFMFFRLDTRSGIVYFEITNTRQQYAAGHAIKSLAYFGCGFGGGGQIGLFALAATCHP